MNSSLRSLLALMMLAASTISAAEQPLLMPMPELLKHLDQSQEWLMLPLAEYQALVAAGKQPKPGGDNVPCGAWIETARIDGTIEDDRRLRLRAELELVAAASGVTRCPLFARLPDAIGSITVDGAPALHAPREGGGVDLLLPGPGRHRAIVTWTVDLAAVAETAPGSLAVNSGKSGILPLPLAAGVAATFHSAGPGDLVGIGLTARDDHTWTLAHAGGSDLIVAWHAGRQGGDAVSAWGLEQTLQIEIPADTRAPRHWRWSARPQLLRGSMPNLITMRLPAGWTATETSTGVLESALAADGSLILRIDPAAGGLGLDGVATASSAIALPKVEGAIWQGGRVVLINATHLDWVLPPRWQPLSTNTNTTWTWRAFAVPGPDAGLTVLATMPATDMVITVTTAVAVGPERWRMSADLKMEVGIENRFSFPIRLPDGWRPVSASCSAPARLAGADANGAISDPPADGILRIDVPQGSSKYRTITIALVLERDPAVGATALTPPTLLGASRTQHRLLIAAAPSLDVQVDGKGWHRDDRAIIPASPAGKTVRTVLDAVGEPPLLTLTATPKRAACEAEVVAWMLPLDHHDDSAVWCRLDLRLTVSDGELDTLILDLPLAPDTIQIADPGLALVREGTRTVLRANRPWRGERLVRIEGRLASTGSKLIAFPRIGVARDDGAAVPTVLHVALQAPERLDLRLEPGAGAQPEDEDDLPRWSRAIPGDPLAGVWRIGNGEPGGFTLVSRELADPPPGFIHHLDVRSQLAADRVHTLLRFRLAAPGLTALPLHLPPGFTLIAASLDGHAVAVRRSGEDGVLPLPGRTQVDIAVLLDGPLLPGRIDLALPGLGGLPVTDLTWTVATDVGWRVRPALTADALHLTPIDGQSSARRWFGSWRDAQGTVDAGALAPAVAAPVASEDPRRLLPPRTAPPAGGEPKLALVGQLWRGERLGGHARLVLDYQQLDALRRIDHLGAALAMLLGAWVAWRLRASAALLCAAGGSVVAISLHLAHLSVGPLLACAEWLSPVIVVLVIARAIGRSLQLRFRPMETTS